MKSEKDVKSWGNRTYQNFYFSLRLFNNYLEEVWEQQKIEEAAGISKI